MAAPSVDSAMPWRGEQSKTRPPPSQRPRTTSRTLRDARGVWASNVMNEPSPIDGSRSPVRGTVLRTRSPGEVPREATAGAPFDVTPPPLRPCAAALAESPVADRSPAAPATAPAAPATTVGRLGFDERVEAREAWDTELTAALRDREIDVLLGRLVRIPSGHRTATIRRDPLTAVLDAGHPLAGRAAVALRELRGETLRFFPRAGAPRYYDGVLAALRTSGETPRVWENRLPGLRNPASALSGRDFMIPAESAARASARGHGRRPPARRPADRRPPTCLAT